MSQAVQWTGFWCAIAFLALQVSFSMECLHVEKLLRVPSCFAFRHHVRIFFVFFFFADVWDTADGHLCRYGGRDTSFLICIGFCVENSTPEDARTCKFLSFQQLLFLSLRQGGRLYELD